jgi:hypothetical protein
MNRFRCRMVPAFALLLAAACSDSFSDGQGDLDHLVASPTQVFLEIGQTKTVDVSGLDAQGNPLTLAYEVTSPGNGIDVRRDSTFLPVYVDDSTLQVPPAGERFRFRVTGTSYTTTSFTVTAAGEEVTIPVQVIPQNVIEAGISNQTPGINEVVTITAPAGTRFSANSVVRLADTTAAQPLVVSVAADGSSLDILLPPNLTEASLTITNVTTEGAPTVTFAPTTALTVTTATVPNLPGTLSTLAPAVNEPVTVTLTGGATFDPAATVIAGATPPAVTSVTPTTLSFIPNPGTTALPLVDGIRLAELPQIAVALPAAITDTIVVSPDVPTIPGTDDPGSAPTLITPAVGFSSVLFDKPAYDGSLVDAFYRLNVTEEGLYTITLDWDIGSDIDLSVCPEGDPVFGPTCQNSFASHPELVEEVPLTPGTYIIYSNDYGADAIGTTLQINVDHAPPEAAAVKRAPSAKVSAKAAPRARR